MVAYPSASAGGMATGVIVEKLPSRLKRGWPLGLREAAAWSPRVRPIVAAPWGCAWRTAAAESRSCRAPVPSGRSSQPGEASNPPCLSSARHLAGHRPKRPAAGLGNACSAGGSGVQGGTESPRAPALWGGAVESPGATACPDVCERASEGNRGRPRPRAAGASALVGLCRRGRSRDRGVGGLGGSPRHDFLYIYAE
jgi:hypothetical protein